MPRPIKTTVEILAAAQQKVKTARTAAELRAALAVVLPAHFGLTRKQTAQAIA